MVGTAQLRFCARHGGIRCYQFGRGVGRAANFAVVAVLVAGVALRAFALDEAIRQEHVSDGVVKLLDGTHFDQAFVSERAIEGLGALPVFVGMGRAVVVESDMEGGKIVVVFLPDARDELFRRDAFVLGAQHDGRAVRVVGADIMAGVAAHFLEAHPDVGLDVFDQMAQMNAAVGVGQGGGDENFSGFSGGCASSHGGLPGSKSAGILANRAHWRRIG